MTPVRVRPTIRAWMALVALAAVAAGGVILLQRSSEAAQRDRCRDNLSILSLGLMNYETANDGGFPRATVDNDGLPPERRLSWLTIVAPFLDQFFWLFDPSQAWDSASNRATRGHGMDTEPKTIGRMMMYCCPAAPGSGDPRQPGWTWYVGIAGVGADVPRLPAGHPRAGMFGYERRTTIGAIKDGTSTTLLLAETGESNGPWTAGGPSTVRGLDPASRPHLGKGRPFGGLHRGGALVAMADGSVKFLAETIDPNVLEALATVAGGEPLPPGWDR